MMMETFRMANRGRVIVESDDLERGMLLTVYSGEIHTVRRIDQYGWLTWRQDVCCELKGVPLKVQAVSLPYVVVRTEDAEKQKIILDTRRVRLSRVSLDYVQAVNAPMPVSGPLPSSLA